MTDRHRLDQLAAVSSLRRRRRAREADAAAEQRRAQAARLAEVEAAEAAAATTRSTADRALVSDAACPQTQFWRSVAAGRAHDAANATKQATIELADREAELSLAVVALRRAEMRSDNSDARVMRARADADRRRDESDSEDWQPCPR